MFIKEAYEKRIKKEEADNTETTQNKKAKTQLIGSVKNEKINYDREEQFFSKEDVPAKAREVKNYIKEFIDPDHLGLRKREWNTSVSVPKDMSTEESHQRKLIKIKLGLFDHPVPKPSEPKIYAGTDTRNDYTNWNVSTEVSKKQVHDDLLNKTRVALQNSKSFEKTHVKNYIDPKTQTIRINERLRNTKMDETQLRESVRQQYKFNNPNASQQKTDAAVFRLVYEKKLKQNSDKCEYVEFPPFRASLTDTQKGKLRLKSHHTGIFQKITLRKKDEVEEVYSWSCCMNEDADSAGCVQVLEDKNRWNLASFSNN